MKNKRWTFSGIKRYAPNLKFETWLKLCKAGGQYNPSLETGIKEYLKTQQGEKHEKQSD